MPNRVPKTYDQITRATVLEPDGSWRPSDQQERQAYTGYRALDADEQALFDDVVAALEATGESLADIRVEVDRDRVILRGEVRTTAALTRLLDAASHVPRVREVCDRLVIAAR